MADEPMSDERLAEIMSLSAEVAAGSIHVRFDEETAWFAILDLRREVERSRAREAAAMEIVRDVVAYATLKRYMDDCEWCGQIGQSVDAHASNCPVTKAHALLAE